MSDDGARRARESERAPRRFTLSARRRDEMNDDKITIYEKPT
ncbi:MAG TPA: hypothetical protein VGB61_11900 [Pyrinomonadaceae bacterium]